MIQAIFFDFDGVLTTDPNGSYTTFHFIAEQTGIDFELLKNVWDEVSADVYIGKRTVREVWTDFCDRLGHSVPYELLDRAYYATRKNVGMFALAAILSKNHVVGIITDNPQERMNFLQKEMRLEELFHIIVGSSDTGVCKDNERIFEIALEKSNVQAHASVFIDNSERNLSVPKEMGFHTYFFDTQKNDIKGFSEYLKQKGVSLL